MNLQAAASRDVQLLRFGNLERRKKLLTFSNIKNWLTPPKTSILIVQWVKEDMGGCTKDTLKPLIKSLSQSGLDEISLMHTHVLKQSLSLILCFISSGCGCKAIRQEWKPRKQRIFRRSFDVKSGSTPEPCQFDWILCRW